MAVPLTAPVGIEANNESNGTEAEGPECMNCFNGGGWGNKMSNNIWTPQSNKWKDSANDWNCPECNFIPVGTDICNWKPAMDDCDIDVVCAGDGSGNTGQEKPGQGSEES